MGQKKCKVCKVQYTPVMRMQCVCSPSCALDFVKTKQAKQATLKAQAEKRQDKAKRESLKTRRDYIKEAQIEFNRYIRLRDKGKPCICCGLPLETGSVGGKYDCGHYRSVGSAPHLRFDERNAHGQRKQCNRYGAGRAIEYRIGLINRLGHGCVDDLEAAQGLAKFTAQDLIDIRDKYRKMARDLEKQDA